MTININDTLIKVSSDYEIVYDRLRQYSVNDTKTSNQLIINHDYLLINIKDYFLEINKELVHTDIYPIVNNIIGYLINDGNNLYIHSVVISKNNVGIMILGDFQSGKTSLATSSLKYGYKINSADQTWIDKENKLIVGSYINSLNKKITYLKKENYLNNIKINKIIILKGLCDNGAVSIIKQDNNIYNVKNLYKFASWHYDMPLFTDNVLLYNQRQNIMNYLININIPIYFVRGDKDNLMEVLDGRKKSIN